MVTIEDLYTEANRFLRDVYDLPLTIDIEIDAELDFAEGCYLHTMKEPMGILIAQFVMDIADDEIIYEVLRHELVHYALHVTGKPFADGCSYFEAELERLEIKSSGTVMVGRYHMYECATCGGDIPHFRKLTEKERMVAKTLCCEAEPLFKNEQAIYNGKERVY